MTLAPGPQAHAGAHAGANGSAARTKMPTKMMVQDLKFFYGDALALKDDQSAGLFQ